MPAETSKPLARSHIRNAGMLIATAALAVGFLELGLAKAAKQLIQTKTAFDWSAVALLGLLLILPAARITKQLISWALWYVLTTAGFMVLFVFDLVRADLIINNYDNNYIMNGIGYLLVSVAGGTLLGSGQWLVLHRQVPIARGWIFASIVTWFVIGFSLFIPKDIGVLGYLGIGAIIGGLASLPQWLVLASSTQKAGWWIPATAAGWAMFTAVGLTYANSEGIAPFIAGASIVASVTGIVLMWLFTSTSDQSPDQLFKERSSFAA